MLLKLSNKEIHMTSNTAESVEVVAQSTFQWFLELFLVRQFQQCNHKWLDLLSFSSMDFFLTQLQKSFGLRSNISAEQVTSQKESMVFDLLEVVVKEEAFGYWELALVKLFDFIPSMPADYSVEDSMYTTDSGFAVFSFDS